MLQLSGWSKARRVVVLRRPLKSPPEAEAETVDKTKSKRKAAKQLTLDLPELTYRGMPYEYAVLVTSLVDEVRTVAQHYRDRGDAENNFDELKNQWGWAGFTTQDRKCCQIMGRIIALVYNWWTIFMRLGIPEKHAEAITSRPLALHGIARQTRHGNQTTVEITSTHAKSAQRELHKPRRLGREDRGKSTHARKERGLWQRTHPPRFVRISTKPIN